jgi:nicotinamide phosphoribosyltransferase
MCGLFGVPLPFLTDSYKPTHYKLYPDSQEISAYGEFRTSFEKDPTDGRLVFYGIRHIIEHYIAKRWTSVDVQLAEAFFKTHNAGHTPFPFPKDLFERVSSDVDQCIKFGAKLHLESSLSRRTTVISL